MKTLGANVGGNRKMEICVKRPS